jgi:hypothetical protein
LGFSIAAISFSEAPAAGAGAGRTGARVGTAPVGAFLTSGEEAGVDGFAETGFGAAAHDRPFAIAMPGVTTFNCRASIT